MPLLDRILVMIWEGEGGSVPGADRQRGRYRHRQRPAMTADHSPAGNGAGRHSAGRNTLARAGKPDLDPVAV